MIAIVFTPEIQKKIHEIVYASEVETGVTLFGKKEGAVFNVTDACGPNPLATHEACHYSGDDYASFVYEELLKNNPELEHLGTLHTHPHRMRHLSKEDGETIKEALKTSEAFIAGVMLRFGGTRYIFLGRFRKERRCWFCLHIPVVGICSAESALANTVRFTAEQIEPYPSAPIQYSCQSFGIFEAEPPR